MIVLILVFLLGGLRKTEAISVTGVLGKEITIKCSHVNAFSNVKYFCKGVCRNEDVLISSRQMKSDSKAKYSIIDEGNTFNVTILDLTEDDVGTYWCGIARTGFDTYNKVVLTVMAGNIKDPNSDLPQSNSNEAINPNASSKKKLVYIGAGLGVIVLALAMVLLIFFRHRNRDISPSSGEDHDTVYATLSSQKQDTHHIITSSSTANEYQKSDGRTNSILSSSPLQHRVTSRDPADKIYSSVTVSLEPQIQPDGLFYSTVSFNKYTNCSTATPRTAAVTYSTIKHISTDESIVYCNV
ncbi:CMRF35-like molecule 1 isoform X1 [Siniperca chuatsi]|uniref:CMRF35-like molecule 1 isoform X1 n=1 Tax=Siniperca chuatsi TaxID=119488 RepID=UPI001CE22D66|nr:CMRF35-like molecule 1 isoform X1 [Siniperca chuatsi]